ncbi:hypothetical protein, partial [Parabacteroides chinchillae]
MKKQLVTVLTGAFALLATLPSCNDSDLVGPGGGGHTISLTLATAIAPIQESVAGVRRARSGSEAAQAGFSYELVSSDADSIAVSGPMTKAPTTLKNVYALLFKSDGTFNGRANIGT